MGNSNIEIIDGIEIYWNKYKGSNINKSKKSYIELCKLLHREGHELLSDYIKIDTKILINYNCGHEPNWVVPNSYKRGVRCPKCGGTSKQNAKEDFIDLVKTNGHELLSDYINGRTKVLINFNCGHEPHLTTPENYKRGNRCPKCSGNCPEQAKEDFMNMINKNNHSLLSEYVDTQTKVLINFNCGHEPNWIRPADYKRGVGCPKCSGHCPKQAKEDFINMLKANGHKLLSEYINNSTKVLIDFNCGHESHWIAPNNYKQGQGCPKCSGHCPKQAKEDFIDLVETNGHKLLSGYTNNSTKVLIDFNCGHEPHWITPNSYKRGSGCPKCAGLCSEQAKEDFFNLINKNNHRILSEYINNSTKVLIDYNCGHEPNWVIPNHYKKGFGCIKCSGLCSEQAKEDLINLINKNEHKLLSEYINANTKVLIDFNCGHEPHWITPQCYKIGQECPKCARNKILEEVKRKTREEYIRLIESNGHKLLSEYIDVKTKVLIDFKCGHKPHWITPQVYKRGSGCPHCYNKGEGVLHKLLIDMGYNTETQKTYADLKDKNYLKYDFYLPEYNLLIELDGEHHRQEVVYTTKDMTELEKDMAEVDAFLRLEDRKCKDKLKDDYAKDNNIPLLRIEYSRGKIEPDKWKQLIGDKIKQINLR